MMNPTDLFFDFDGTLLDTAADVYDDMRATLGEMGLSVERFDTLFRIGPPLTEAIQTVYDHLPLETTLDFIERFKARYDRSDYPRTVPYPGIDPLLRRLKSEGRRLFLATNKRDTPTRRLLDKFDWASLFTDVLTVDGRGYPWTKPEMLAETIYRRNIDPTMAVMTGDSMGDLEAGKAADFRTVAVGWGYEPADDLKNAGSDWFVESVEELSRLWPTLTN